MDYEGVLVVDDDVLMGRALMRTLRRLESEQGEGGKAALQRLQTRRYAVVLCDLKMHDLDGVALYTQILATDPEQARRFIFMTGGAYEDRYEAFLSTVDNPVLTKPFESAELWALLAEFGLTEPKPRA